MAGNAGSLKALAITACIAYGLFLLYCLYKLNEIWEKVNEIADHQARPRVQPDKITTIDVTPEGVTEKADSKHENTQAIATQANPADVTESRIKSAQSDSEWRHSEDFRSVMAYGETFSLTLYQSRAIEKLWNAQKNLIPELHQAAILEGIESCSKRLRDIFKSNMEAYRVLIARGERKGTFRLNLNY